MEDLLQEEVVKLEEELTKLKSAVEYIETAKISIEAASKIINTIIKLKEEFDKLSEKAYVLIGKVDNVDFPGRFDKVDSKMAALSSEFQSLLARVETGDKTLSADVKILSKSILNDSNDTKNKIIGKLDSQSKDIKRIFYSITGILAFLVIFTLLYFMKIL